MRLKDYRYGLVERGEGGKLACNLGGVVRVVCIDIAIIERAQKFVAPIYGSEFGNAFYDVAFAHAVRKRASNSAERIVDVVSSSNVEGEGREKPRLVEHVEDVSASGGF